VPNARKTRSPYIATSYDSAAAGRHDSGAVVPSLVQEFSD